MKPNYFRPKEVTFLRNTTNAVQQISNAAADDGSGTGSDALENIAAPDVSSATGAVGVTDRMVLQ